MWFDKAATTFAQAPFELAALNPLTMGSLNSFLIGQGYFDADFLLSHPFDYAAREASITDYMVEGEVLSEILFLLPNVVGTSRHISLGGSDPHAVD